MSNQILPSQEDDIVHARISGVMTLADQQALETLAKKLIDAGRKVRLLVTLADFEGWEKNEAWGDDLQFQLDYGNDILRIAIIGEHRWKDQALMFVGKGFRDTAIEFFVPDSLDAAKAWVRGQHAI